MSTGAGLTKLIRDELGCVLNWNGMEFLIEFAACISQFKSPQEYCDESFTLYSSYMHHIVIIGQLQKLEFGFLA